jgi:hypothetical protein
VGVFELPGRDASEISWLLFNQSGVLTTGQAVDLLGRTAVRRHLAVGRWRRVGRGILVAHNAELNADQQRWVALLAAGEGALLAGPTALAASGVRLIRDQTIHIAIPAIRGRSIKLPTMPADMASIRVVRTRVLPEEHIQIGRPPRTTTARAAVDAAAWAEGAREALAILAAVCQQRRATPEEIFEVLAIRRSLPRRRVILAAMSDIAGGAHALSEIDFLALCARFGLPSPARQHRRRDVAGRFRYLDAYWPSWRLHVEIDGAHHMQAAEWVDDMVRQNDVWIKGDRLLRFPAALIRLRPDTVAAQLKTALEAAGWQR